MERVEGVEEAEGLEGSDVKGSRAGTVEGWKDGKGRRDGRD